jgi:hypothetical protein
MKKQWQLVTMLFVFLASLVMTSFPLATVAEAKGTVVRIALKGSAQFPSVKGAAKYKVDGAQREFQVEVENIKSLAGQRLRVLVNGTKVGTFVVNSLGAGRLNLNTTRGNTVPVIVTGSRIQIKTGTGALVASGRF